MRKGKILFCFVSFAMALAMVYPNGYESKRNIVQIAAAESDFVIEDGVLTKYQGQGGDVTIPSGVTSIGERAFFYCDGVTSIKIPKGVTSIKGFAFEGCSGLTSIEIPEGVTRIGDTAFYGCRGLTSIKIPDSVTNIGERAFDSCSGLENIELPSGVTRIRWSTFYGCTSLTSIKLPSGVTSIGADAFRNCSGLTSIKIPDNVTSIGDYAFSGCSGLTSIEIPEGVTSIAWGTFSDCGNLVAAAIYDNVTEIANESFENLHKNFKIYCHKDSYVKTYAKENHIPYVLAEGDVGKAMRKALGIGNQSDKPNPEQTVPEKDFTFKESKITLKKGQKTKITITSKLNTEVTYRSLTPSIASVNKKGIVTAKKTGKTKIIVKANGVSKKFNVTVVR